MANWPKPTKWTLDALYCDSIQSNCDECVLKQRVEVLNTAATPCNIPNVLNYIKIKGFKKPQQIAQFPNFTKTDKLKV